MVTNPIVGVYTSITQISIKSGMTIPKIRELRPWRIYTYDIYMLYIIYIFPLGVGSRTLATMRRQILGNDLESHQLMMQTEIPFAGHI